MSATPSGDPVPLNCFCGGTACVCEVAPRASDEWWRIHCQDCDWSYGGSSLEACRDRNAVILEWNRRVQAVQPSPPNPFTCPNCKTIVGFGDTGITIVPPVDKPSPLVPCVWSPDDPDWDSWVTSCGQEFVLTEGSPTDNEMKFCCYCGKPVVEQEPEALPKEGA